MKTERRSPGEESPRARGALVRARHASSRARLDVQCDELDDEPREVQVEHPDGAAPGDARDLGGAEPRVFRVVPEQRRLAEVAFGGHAGCERAGRKRTEKGALPGRSCVARSARGTSASSASEETTTRVLRSSRSATGSRGFRRPRLGSTERRHCETHEATLGTRDPARVLL